MARDRLVAWFSLAFLLFLAYQGLRLLEPFFSPILAAFTTVVMCYPLHRRIGVWLGKNRPDLQAGLSVLAVLLFLIGPLSLMITSTVNEAQDLLPQVKTTARETAETLRSHLRGSQTWKERVNPAIMSRLRQSSAEFEERLQSVVESGAQWIVGSAAEVAKNLAAFFVGLALFLFILYFLFRDGPAMYLQLRAALPLSSAAKNQLTTRIEQVVEGVVRGTLVVGMIQGLFAMVGFVMVGTRASVLLGCLTAIASLIPAVGTAITWVPVCVIYLVTGSLGKGLFILIWGLLLSVVDNVVRPYVVGKTFEMPFLWLTLALFGGLHVFGFKGLLLGPLIFGLIPIFLDVLRPSASAAPKT